MVGRTGESTTEFADPRRAEDSSVGGEDRVARRLAREFTAPVGLLDPTTLIWRARLGIEVERFPDSDASLLAIMASGLLRHGRVEVWRPDGDSALVWLCLPIFRLNGPNLVALIGFAATATAEPGWGPPCPERALRAWGQSVADSLKAEILPRLGQGASPFRGEGGDRLLTARLIRRLRVSDPPERFQDLALQALRAALRVEAVAWVPAAAVDPVLVIGAVSGLDPDDFRALPPTDNRPAILLDNARGSRPDSGPIRRVLGVAAETDAPGPIGWIVAVNPDDDRSFAANEVALVQPVASLVATQRTNGRLYCELKELLFGVIRSLTAAIDAKDPYTSGHSERVARIAVRLGEELKLSPNQRGDLYLMGLLHDVGKIGIDDTILKKDGPLTPEEYRIIQSHVEIGVHILTDLKKLHHLLPGVAHHHEQYNGSGYPGGLAGDSIPLPARILAVADGFDAMSSTRPYRKPLTPKAIDEILRKGAGAQWDPKVIAALFACRDEIEAIRQKGLGESLQKAVEDTVGRS